MAMDFDGAVAFAKKTLGDNVKIPKASPALLKTEDEIDAAYKKFDKTRKALEGDILAFQRALAGRSLAMKQYAEQIEKSNLGADTKDADYKKKRAEVQKNFDGVFDGIVKTTESNIKNADELDKHLMDISNYKAPKETEL